MVRSHRAQAAGEQTTNVATQFPTSTRIASKNAPGLDLGELSDENIHALLSSLRQELHERALASGDPEVLGLEMLGDLNGKDVEKPQILGERFVGLGGVIKYNSSATKHTCVLYTVNMPGAEPFWAWEDHGTLAYSQSVKVGDTRQSVAVHVAVDGMQFIRHTMKHDGERHTRLSEDVWDCVWADNGEGKLTVVSSKTKPRNLPLPNH